MFLIQIARGLSLILVVLTRLIKFVLILFYKIFKVIINLTLKIISVPFYLVSVLYLYVVNKSYQLLKKIKFKYRGDNKGNINKNVKRSKITVFIIILIKKFIYYSKFLFKNIFFFIKYIVLSVLKIFNFIKSKFLYVKYIVKLYFMKTTRFFYDILIKYTFFEIALIFIRHYSANYKTKLVVKKIYAVKDYAKSRKVNKFKVIEASKERCICKPFFYEKEEQEIIQFKSPEIYIAELSKVTIIGASSVIMVENKFLNDSVYYDKENRINISFSSLKRVYKKVAIIELSDEIEYLDKGIYLVGAGSFNYYHLLIEIMSRLTYLEKTELYDNIPILVDEVVAQIPQFNEALIRINKDRHEVIFLRKGISYKVNELIIPSSNVWMPINLYNRDLIRDSDFMIAESVLKNIRNELKVENKQEHNRRIFISRKNTQAVRLKNEENVRDIFKRNGYEIIFTEELTFEQQINLFNQAKVIVATSGAALTNIIFCQPDTIIGCIIPMSHHFYMYSTIAYLLELRPLFLDATIIERTMYTAADTFYLDSNYVERYLKFLDANK